MSVPPIPVVFEPLLKPKPWGGRRLGTLLNKRLPAGEPIGESWELVSLPGNESRVRDGPLAGQTLAELVPRWGRGLLGEAELADGRFPLLIKFLDARQNLSVQAHPKPAPDDPAGRQPGVKHECWYVIHADPGARLLIGLRAGLGPDDVARAANTPAIAHLLRDWPARPGDCYYLPSGTPHTLGGGLVVAEIQTPSDVTYRAFDWQRLGLDGRPRELHVEAALQNIRYDITEGMIAPQPREVSGAFGPATRLVGCDRFRVDRLQRQGGFAERVPTGQMRIWIVIRGEGRLNRGELPCAFATGDVVLIPADNEQSRVELVRDSEWLEVTIPQM